MGERINLLARIQELQKENKQLKEENEILKDKATPKRPKFDEAWLDEETTSIYDENGQIDPILCICPNCMKKKIYDAEYGEKFKHCYDCGQAIDWSDKDE